MPVFVDSSALLAVLNRNDLWAVRAACSWRRLVEDQEALTTTSYVVLETVSIVQRRIGLDAVRVLCDALLPLIEVAYVDIDLHAAAVSNLLVANRRELSLVDCCSFEYMRRSRLFKAFAYDKHFEEQGFECCDDLPPS